MVLHILELSSLANENSRESTGKLLASHVITSEIL